MKKPILAAFFLLLGLMAQAMAVTTTSQSITNTSWTLIGSGPMQVQSPSLAAYIIADTLPSPVASPAFGLQPGETRTISTTSNVYARTYSDASGVVTWAPLSATATGAAGTASTAGGISSFSRIPSSAATTNLTLAKTGATRVYKVYACNTTTTAKFIRFYNAAATASVTVGTTAVVFSRVLPASAAAGTPLCQSFDQADIGWSFSSGAVYALTGANADSDTTALAAGDVTQISVEYQ